MLRTFSLFAVVAACLLCPGSLFAGGAPWLCLPVDGVKPHTVKVCTDLLNARLDSKLWRLERRIEIQEHANQWYVSFHMGRSVALSEVAAALKGSDFSIPHDKLRLFGHAILEIAPGTTPHTELLADLKTLNYVSVAESEDKNDRLLVTVDMPYPEFHRGQERLSVAWDTFRRNGLNSNPASKPEAPATAATLPSYNAFRDLVAKHDASLKDVRWSENYGCRPLGCVAAPAAEEATSSEVTSLVGKWKVEFANGVNEVCVVGNGGTAVVDEPQRSARGILKVKDGSVVMTFKDDRVERWTTVGTRVVVEHWFPGSQFPTATPVLGIAERTPQ